MSRSMIESLEGRKLFAVDFAVNFGALLTELPRYVNPTVVTKGSSKIGISNAGDNLGKGVKPADVNLVLRPVSGGTGGDIIVGKVKGSVLTGIKAGKTKLVSVPLTIPKNVAQQDYNLTISFNGASIGDVQPLNNDSIILNTLTTVTTNPPGPLDKYNLGNKIRFRKTGVSDGHGIAGTVHEVGTFTDSKGQSGTYDVVIQNPRIPLPGVLDFDGSFIRNGNTEFLLTTRSLRTLNNVTIEFTNDAKGSIGSMQILGEGFIYLKKSK